MGGNEGTTYCVVYVWTTGVAKGWFALTSVSVSVSLSLPLTTTTAPYR